MFNPSNLDDVCVQATHLEARGKHANDTFVKKSFTSDSKSKGKDKGKKKMATVKKEGEKPTCLHCQKGHDVSKCWKLHPELRPKKYGGNKDKGKATAAVIQDLGSDSGDETKVTVVRIQGKDKGTSLPIDAQSSYSASTNMLSTSKLNDKDRSALFHVHVIENHTKIDTLFDSGSQVNLIS